jgi:hypothetical protein
METALQLCHLLLVVNREKTTLTESLSPQIAKPWLLFSEPFETNVNVLSVLLDYYLP